MKIYEIERGSEAWDELFLAFTNAGTRMVRIGDDGGLFKVKVNEWTWTRALKTTWVRPFKATPPEGPS